MTNDINIALLGETGVGKSTFLNTLINMIFYDTMDEAATNETKVLIPSQFTVTKSKSTESEIVKIGSNDDNEVHTAGESSTQECRSYVFRFGQRQLRIIDTPGIGDVRGPEQDRENFENVLSHISRLEYLNGIIILLKPTQTRLNIYFRFCIKELLRHLHVNAKDNLVFLFTHGRSSFYRPGETVSILRKLLESVKEQTNISIIVNEKNTFTIDNEPFRYLAAYKQGTRFTEDEKQEYAKSWLKTVDEMSRFLRHILTLDLHAVQDTISLNEAIQKVRILSRPIAEITRLIEANITLGEELKSKIINSQSSTITDSLIQLEGELVNIPKRLTVCTYDKCTRVVVIDGSPVVDYHSHCHSGCSLKRVVQECIGDPILRKCTSLIKTGKSSLFSVNFQKRFRLGNCEKCGCHWDKHMHITYRFERRSTEYKLNVANDENKGLSAMKAVDERIRLLKEEGKQIKDINIQLSKFIRQNALSLRNDDTLSYIRLFLMEENQKQTLDPKSSSTAKALKRLIEEYERETQNSKSNDTPANDILQMQDVESNSALAESILTLVGRLYKLPIYGKLIRNQVQAMERMKHQYVAKKEHKINLPSPDQSSSKLLTEFRKIIGQ